MIKQVLIPLAVLGKKNHQILELYIESRWFKPASCFEALKNSGLTTGIEMAETALFNLNQPFGAGMIYAANSQPPLSNAQGTAAGLVMAYLMTLYRCYHKHLIVSAGLDRIDSKSCLLTYTGFWEQKFTAILTLKPPSNPVPLILAQDTPLTHSQIERLLQHNIQPCLFESLIAAIEFCLYNKF